MRKSSFPFLPVDSGESECRRSLIAPVSSVVSIFVVSGIRALMECEAWVIDLPLF